MKGRSFALLAALLAGVALGQAASQVSLSIETLAAKAEAVVHGKQSSSLLELRGSMVTLECLIAEYEDLS